jgi:O-antigen/teichoic acid export membrane protein
VAAYRHVDRPRTERIVGFSLRTGLIMGSLAALSFVALAPWLARTSLAAEHLQWPLQISAVLLLVNTLIATQTGILFGLEAFKAVAKINLWTGLLSLPLIVGGGWAYGLEGAVWGQVAAAVVQWLATRMVLRTTLREDGLTTVTQGVWREKDLLWQSTLPTLLGGTSYNAALWIGSVLLVRGPAGYAEMGIYNAANQWFAALLFLPGVLGQAAIPVLSDHISQRDHARARELLFQSLKINLAVILPIFVAGALLSPWIMGLYGADFRSGWPTLVLALLAATLAAVQAPPGQLLFSAGRIWLCAALNMLAAAAFVAGALWLAHDGSAGLALSRVLSYLAYAGLSLWLAMRLLSSVATARATSDP